MSTSMLPETATLELEALLAELGIQRAGFDGTAARWLIIAAHPDDETIGAAWILRRAREAHVLHLTDGAPMNRALWPPRAPDTRREYSALRASEARQALSKIGFGADRLHSLGWVDQEPSHDLVELTRQVQRFIEALAPTVIVVQPYEGGHPDHDAAAFAVHLAVRRIRSEAPATAPVLIEMSSYHRWQGTLRTGELLPGDSREAERRFSDDERAGKATMLACFASQTEVLAAFTTHHERFRRPPRYDFRAPPHPGLLHYESLGWPMTGERWRKLAASALAELDSPPRLAPSSAAITIDELHEIPDLAALAPEWEALWERCPDATVFQRPDWLLPWCTHLLQGEPCVVTIRRGATLVGLAPFFLWREGDFRVLSLLGAGASDYLDVLAAPDERPIVARALETWLSDHPTWDRCEWSELRSTSLLLTLTPPGRSMTSRQDICPGLVLTDHHRLQDALSPSLWARVAYARRRAVREADLSIEEATPETLAAVFDHLEALHTARWHGRGSTGMLADASTCAFHREVSQRLLARGALLLSALRLHGEIAAVLYGFRDRSASRYYLSGFRPEHGHFSPGTLLVAHAIEGAIERGAALFDFLRGAEPYKYGWGAQDVAPLYRRLISRRSPSPP